MNKRSIVTVAVVILLVAAAGVGYWKREQVIAYYQHVVKTRSLDPKAVEPPSALPPELAPPLSPDGTPSAVAPESLPPSDRPIDRRRTSRLPPPGSPRAKPFADPLEFYVLKRRVIRSPTGVLAVSPGDTVELRERMKDGRMRVYVDGAQFIMQPADLTQELAVAREAETTYLDSLRRQ